MSAIIVALIDLVAIAPFYVDLIISGDAAVPTTFVRVVRLLRVFKADEYVGAFRSAHFSLCRCRRDDALRVQSC